jgi:hypothetical protein
MSYMRRFDGDGMIAHGHLAYFHLMRHREGLAHDEEDQRAPMTSTSSPTTCSSAKKSPKGVMSPYSRVSFVKNEF